MVLLFLGTKTSALFTKEAAIKKFECGAPAKFPQVLNIINTMAVLLIFKFTHCQIIICQENYGAFSSVQPSPPTMKTPYYHCDYVLRNKMENLRKLLPEFTLFYFTLVLWITFQFQQKLKPKNYFLSQITPSTEKYSTCKFMCKHDILTLLHINFYFTGK